MIKASAPKTEGPEFESRFRRDFSGSSRTSDFKIGTPLASLPGAWRYRVSTGTGRPGVSILWLGEVESLIGSSVSVWQHVNLSEQIRPWDTLACCWDVKQPTDKQSPALSVFCCSVSIFVLSFVLMSPLFHVTSPGVPFVPSIIRPPLWLSVIILGVYVFPPTVAMVYQMPFHPLSCSFCFLHYLSWCPACSLCCQSRRPH